MENCCNKDQAVSKNTYYRFLNETSYNWGRFLLLLSAKVTAMFDALTRPERVKVLILDDSVTVIKRNRSKSVELLARIYDHVKLRFQKGMMHKTEAAILLIQRALQSGIQADYVLMDTLVHNGTHDPFYSGYRARCDRHGQTAETTL